MSTSARIRSNGRARWCIYSEGGARKGIVKIHSLQFQRERIALVAIQPPGRDRQAVSALWNVDEDTLVSGVLAQGQLVPATVQQREGAGRGNS